MIAELGASPLPVDTPGATRSRPMRHARATGAGVQQSCSHRRRTPQVRPRTARRSPAVRDAVHAVAPGVPVGAAIDGAVAPKATVAALGRALERGRTRHDRVPARGRARGRGMDDHEPAAARRRRSLQAFGGRLRRCCSTACPTPTTIPPVEAPPYAGAPPAVGAVSPVAQGTAYGRRSRPRPARRTSRG